MSTTLTDQIFAALAEFSSASRLYELKIGDGGETGLLVEAFVADDGVQEVGARDVIALSTDAFLELDTLLGQAAALEICLADGQRERFAGEISEAAMLGSDGGLARYRIRISQWLWRLGQVRNSRVWQDKSVIDIVDAVFADYLPSARWRWSEDTASFLDEVAPRSYCCQYRESDLDFVRRLLAEEGLCWRFEQTGDGPGLVLFADSSQLCAVPEDASSACCAGIRFHGARSVEESDSIQALSAQRRLHASLTTVLSYDYKAKQVVGASSPSHDGFGKLPVLESYEVPGQYAYANRQQAQHDADLRMQEQEARGQVWRGRATVRTLRAGTRMRVLGAPLQQLADSASFTVLRVLSIGVNNMPPSAQHALAELFGPIPELLEDLTRTDMPKDLALAIGQARETGYANCFSAVATDIVWRPPLMGRDANGYPKPLAFGAQSAIVVGADGNDRPGGADELYCDRLGRIRIRFHWQDSGNAACWVRVAQRSAGGGMGQQFLPRIGQEVLVQFLENDIDRPIVVGALYNGQGEGGVLATPGGRRDKEADLSCFEAAHDHAVSGQGNLSGGYSPVWHGASADSAGHRNPAAQWGIRSKEFGGYGYSQLLFDDTDGQGRVQFKCTHVGSELNLGHVIHTSDNHRGSIRGDGVELRTDAYGVTRAAAGLLVSSDKLNVSISGRDPAGSNAAGVALMRQAVAIADTFSSAAAIHQSVKLAAHLGTTKANESVLDPAAAPLKAAFNALSGMCGAKGLQAALTDARARNTDPNGDKIPYLTGPLIAVAAQGDICANAGLDMQLASGESASLMCAGDSQHVTGGQMRLQSNQAIGLLGNVIRAGEANKGLELITTKDIVDIQSQADELKISAANEISIASVSDHVDFGAAKKISFSTIGGANITLEGGNIVVQAPGSIKVCAGKKCFAGGAKRDYFFPVFPVSFIKADTGYKLESTFALDQLTAYALSCTEGEFIGFLLPVFGFDISPKIYLKLYEKLRRREIENAKIVVMNGGHYPAEFDNGKREIRVHKAAVDRAVKNNGEAWELLAALLHEFGHYVDVVLRKDLSAANEEGRNISDDSEGEEGAKFAYAIAAFDFSGANTEYARLESPIYRGVLKVNHADVRDLILKSQGGNAQIGESRSANIEYFSANREHERDDSHGHETIEEGLLDAGQIFRRKGILKQIYFGNWLRDHSQLLDPKVVRAKSDPRDMSRYLSRNALTRIVSVLGKKKFGATEENKKIYAVTEDRLKVYRAREHIDNPTNNGPIARDPREIDPDFEALPNSAYLAVDPATCMKRYIKASRDYMSRELSLAADLGPTVEGLIHFGAGLHVLEDYFSHSNFVELGLRKIGHTKVLPWTSAISTQRGDVLPVVTGMFASEDVVASLAGVIADLFFKVEWEYKAYKPGVPTEADEVALILLEEHSDQELTKAQREGRSTLLEKYKEMMILRDKWMSLPGQSVLGRINHYTIGSVFNARNMFLNAIVQQVGANVDDAQVYAKGDPNTNGSTDPSHSQLAKDHDTHPFHTLAAELAMLAVIQVGKSMAARWDGNAAADPGKVAATFLVHPNTSNWQDSYVKNWAKVNPSKVKRGESATEAEHWMKEVENHHKTIIKNTADAHRASFDYISKYYDVLFGSQSGKK